MTARVGFAGLSHLGLVYSTVTASRGFDVVGYDSRESLVSFLQRGTLPVDEPGLDELFSATASRRTISSDPQILNSCDLIFVSADVPTDDKGSSDLQPIRSLLAYVSANRKPDATVVVLSQVPPGFTRSLTEMKDPIYYQVETLVFGVAVERAQNPERYIIGCRSTETPIPQPYEEWLAAFGVPVLKMRYESAELAKIAINVCLVATLSVTNTLARLCERIGADWSEIAPALRLDARIGPRAYLTPGLGIAGGNLERDMRTVVNLSIENSVDHSVIDSFITDSRLRRDWVKQVLLREFPAGKVRVAVLGLAYKEGTNSVKNAPSVELLTTKSQFSFVVHDPKVGDMILGKNVTRVDTEVEALTDADAVVVMTPWPQYKELSAKDLSQRMNGRVVVDPFRVLDGTSLKVAGFRYLTLGVSSDA